jgi:ferredoxin
VCWSTCPDVFEQNQDDGHSQIVEKHRAGAGPGAGEIPKELEDCARNAADGCPVTVIHVE